MSLVSRYAAYERTPKALTGAELKNCDKLATMHSGSVGDSRGVIPEAQCFAPPLRESLSIDSQLLTTSQADGSACAQAVGWSRGDAMAVVLHEVRGGGEALVSCALTVPRLIMRQRPTSHPLPPSMTMNQYDDATTLSAMASTT